MSSEIYLASSPPGRGVRRARNSFAPRCTRLPSFHVSELILMTITAAIFQFLVCKKDKTHASPAALQASARCYQDANVRTHKSFTLG